MHAVLFKGQGVTIERPQRALGVAVAAVPALIAVGLGMALVVKVATWPVSLTMFGAITAAIVLFVIGLVFAFWAYACYSLRYLVDRDGVTIVWGALRHFVPVGRIESMSMGRGEDRPRVSGLSWPGLHVGRGEAAGQEALFYSTHRVPEEVLYIHTGTTTYGLSPADPPRFMAEVERFRQSTEESSGVEIVERDIVGGHPIWADRVAQWLALTGVAINLALWGYIFAIYPDLSPSITIEFPPLGEITDVHSRSEILKIPAAALGVLVVNLAAGLFFQWRERAATYLLLSGSVFMQLLFWVSAGIAVSNA